MALEKFEVISVDDTDTQDIYEMKMMRFIFSLPVGDIMLVPGQERSCVLCKEPFKFEWNIGDRETAVVLPCGHFVGLICIRKWLSPFEDGNRKCPFQGCDTVFPCPVNSLHSHSQKIVKGKLRPTKKVRFPNNMNLVDSGTGSHENDEWKTNESDSVDTEERKTEVVDGVPTGNIEDESLSHHNAEEMPSTGLSEASEDVSIIGSEERWQAENSEAEASEIRSIGKWAMVRKAISRATRRRGKGHAY